jgi:HAD superfamily hydrolase (TIGR01490 family)
MTQEVAAFFDMDRTLITVNSARLWVGYLWRQGELSKRDLLRSAAGLLGYRLAIVDMEKLARAAVERLQGEHEGEMRRRVRQWYDAEIRHTVREQMLDVVEDHRRRGHRLVLLTASSPYIAEPLAGDLDLDHVISSRFEVDEGRFTGRLIEPLCYADGKVHLSERWAAERSVDLDKSWFYSDSFTDVPMLERVGNPVVVDPDARLQRWARREGVQMMRG